MHVKDDEKMTTKPWKVLFHKDRSPIDPRCIKRFAHSFPKGYQTVVRTVIEKSRELDREETFKDLVATLMSSFKMTRRGPFQGVKVYKGRGVDNQQRILETCWTAVQDKLHSLRQDLKDNCSKKRGRILVEISPGSRKRLIEKTNKAFNELMQKGNISRVAASKILFAALPEVALPVDTAEWKSVFAIDSYQEVLLTMVNEIQEWEKEREPAHLEELDPYPRATLPAIYNVMAMVARP